MITETINRVYASAASAIAPVVVPCNYYSPSVLARALKEYDHHYGYALLAARAAKLRQELDLLTAISELQNEASDLKY